MSSDSERKRLDLHLSELQRVKVAFPVSPVYTGARAVLASQVTTIQVGLFTCTVPPGTFVRYCTRALWPHIVVLVSSTELVSELIC